MPDIGVFLNVGIGIETLDLISITIILEI